MLLELPPATSASQLQAWAACPRKYLARYVLHLEPEYRSTALILGSVVHSSLGWWFDERREGRAPERDDVLHILAADLTAELAETTVRWKDESPESLELEARRLVSLYLDRYGDEDVTACEVPFEVALEDPETGEVRGRPLKGYFDFTLASEAVVELKTSARGWNADDLHRHIQVGAYAYAHMMNQGGMSDIDIRVLVKTKTPKLEGFHVARGEPATRWFLAAAWAIEEAIAAGHFPPAPSPLCSSCEYARACRENDWMNLTPRLVRTATEPDREPVLFA